MSYGPENKRTRSPLGKIAPFVKVKDVEPWVRPRLVVAAVGALLAVVLFVAWGGCGERAAVVGAATAVDVGAPSSTAVFVADAASLRDERMWRHATDGEAEDLMTLAVHEGPIGLVEAAASDPELRPTAIKAMGFARGWAHLPFLARTASGKDDEEARLALEATLELATRPQSAEDPEDAPELIEGCEALIALGRDGSRPRERRVAAIRALRMMPCSPPKDGEGLPTDVDSK